jgi:hypothetical protein
VALEAEVGALSAISLGKVHIVDGTSTLNASATKTFTIAKAFDRCGCKFQSWFNHFFRLEIVWAEALG